MKFDVVFKVQMVGLIVPTIFYVERKIMYSTARI